MRPRALLTTLVAALLCGLLAGCSAPLARTAETAADKTTPPVLGACYRLTPEATTKPSSSTASVPCSSDHTAQTFAIGNLPASTGKSWDAPAHGTYVFNTCQAAFMKFVGIDDSIALRVQLSWAWFRPSQKGWDKGARWYRCDLVGGSAQATAYRPLPSQGKGMLRRLDDHWMTCARGPEVTGSVKLPCSEKHDWRAVTTIKLGEPADAWPGDRLAEVRTRDYCSDSVGAWMHYPVEYDYGYTYFREAEWKAGNRRSVCWAKTAQ